MAKEVDPKQEPEPERPKLPADPQPGDQNYVPPGKRDPSIIGTPDPYKPNLT